MSDIFISILIPIYNGIEFLQESISSVKNQTHKNWEVIIGINGHPENSDVYQQANRYSSDKIKVFDLHTIKGKSNALNQMVKLAKYDRIAILDVDDMWLPNKLEKQVDIIKKKNYDVVGTNCRYFGEMNMLPRLNTGLINNEIFKRSNTIINSSAIIKKSLAYWNPEYDSVEDYELWVRLAKSKKTFYNLREILTLHRIHPNSAFNTQVTKQEDLVRKIKNVYYRI